MSALIFKSQGVPAPWGSAPCDTEDPCQTLNPTLVKQTFLQLVCHLSSAKH